MLAAAEAQISYSMQLQLDVVSLPSVAVISGIDVAHGSAPHVLEASVVGRVANRGGRRAHREYPMHCWNGGGLGDGRGGGRGGGGGGGLGEGGEGGGSEGATPNLSSMRSKCEVPTPAAAVSHSLVSGLSPRAQN